jgi:hypothetical protein
MRAAEEGGRRCRKMPAMKVGIDDTWAFSKETPHLLRLPAWTARV